MKSNENPPSGNLVVPCRQTDRGDMTKLIVLFEILRKVHKKLISTSTLYYTVEISMKFYFKFVRPSKGM